MSQAAREAGEATGQVVGDAAATARETARDVKEAVLHAKDEVKMRARAVAETGRRATDAPGRIAGEVKLALQAWWRGVTSALAMAALLAVFGIVTLIVLTIALVVGLNEAVGDPQGTWLVVGLYAVAMIAFYAVARAARKHAREEVRQRMENSREEARHVVAPVKRAFGGRGSI